MVFVSFFLLLFFGMTDDFLYEDSSEMYFEKNAMNVEDNLVLSGRKLTLANENNKIACSSFEIASKRLRQAPEALGREQLLRRAEVVRDFAGEALDKAQLRYAHLLEVAISLKRSRSFEDISNAKCIPKISKPPIRSSMAVVIPVLRQARRDHTVLKPSSVFGSVVKQGPMDKYMVGCRAL